MDGRGLFDGGATVQPESSNGIATVRPTTVHPSLQPNYNCPKVQEALEHLASIDLIELCNEAKVEHCRATRDLRSCGRCVQSMLISCGHASLCEECGQRCDACPICRFPIPKSGNKLRIRLYYECIVAGLISKRYDDRFQEKDGEKRSEADVERLYSFFDVALENNLVSLICHYITDVCMDETAVSSDPVVALLLDEVVVKDWCKRTFRNIVAELQGIYKLTIEEINERSSALLKFTVRLSCISTVLEVLESSFKGSLSAQLNDIHQLQESILKTKQHTELIIWYTKHHFLEGLNRHGSFSSWRADVRGRKSAAIQRAWPDPVPSSKQDGPTLFIEDALSNLEIEHEYSSEIGEALEIASLQKDGGLSFSRVKIEGMVGCYPFEDLRSAIDILFLCGSSDMVVAKQAILLYYLFDRLWKIHDDQWRFCIDEFAATFNVTRHSILESFTFYLLDDQSDEALQEACRLLPEISSPSTHPKVAQVLLERQNPYEALMVLRWCGRDGGPELVSLGEAVTAVRVRVECGLLIEAYMYQKTLCTKVKSKKLRHELHQDSSNELKDDSQAEMNWVEVLVTEFCILCIRRNLVDRIIGLPWNLDEEKYLRKCFLDYALDNPLSNAGSLLVVFYLQRYRYMEAYQVDRKLQSIEQDFLSENTINEENKTRMRSTSHWRAGLVDKSIQLMPEVEQQKIKSGKLPESVYPGDDINSPTKLDLPGEHNPNFTSLLVPSVESSVLFQMGNEKTSSVQESPFKISELSNFSTVPHAEIGVNMMKSISKSFKFDDIKTTPLKEYNRGSSRIRQNEKEHNGIDRFTSSSPYLRSATANLEGSPNGLFKGFHQDRLSDVSGKSVPSGRLGREINVEASGDFMDMSWSNKEERMPAQMNPNGGPRWRSDDASDDEEYQSPDRFAGTHPYGILSTRIRKSKFSRR